MKLTSMRVVAAIALAIIVLLSVVFLPKLFWPEGLQNDADGPIIPMPFHSTGYGENTPVLSAQEILTEYRIDSDAARNKYAGRPVWVKGTVTEMSGPTVTLEGPKGITCVYVSTLQQARLTIGRKATVEGTLKGSPQSGDMELFRPWKKKV
jgi:tRNA_anti-like